MIIRKPYAFLIKNFRKVHIVLLLLSLYVLYKLLSISGFISDFMAFGAYDYYNDPITKYISFSLYVVLGLLVLICFLLVLLLKRKEKPWKMYLIPIIEYVGLFLVLSMIKSFFAHYSNSIATTDLRLSRDLLFILIIGSFATTGIFVMRVLGLDVKKFDFASDQEFLELSEEDREEVEIRVKIDKNIFIRFFNRIVRHLNYFYLEHKRICNAIGIVLAVVIVGSLAKTMFVTNKSYKEGDFYSANGYTIKINDSYFTDKDYKGDIISKTSNFVIIDLTMTNKSAPRTIRLENFHLKNGVSEFSSTGMNYEKEFQDLGKTYESVKELARDETADMIVVFKVDKDLRKDNFSLFYQEKDGNLRKIRLKITDISKIEDKGIINLGEELTLKLKPNEEKISFYQYSFSPTVSYTIRKCTSETCSNEKENYTAEKGSTVLKIDFASIDFEGKDMVDFSSDYGKINYIDNSKMEQSVEFKYPFKKQALGKRVFTLVPEEVAQSDTLEIVYVIRNEKYTYKLK